MSLIKSYIILSMTNNTNNKTIKSEFTFVNLAIYNLVVTKITNIDYTDNTNTVSIELFNSKL